MSDFDLGKWEEWCNAWNVVNRDNYPSFAVGLSGDMAGFHSVIQQAMSEGDMRMIRAVCRHAPRGSSPKELALTLALQHAEEMNEDLLARDVYMNADNSNISASALAVYERITGHPISP